MFKVSALVPDDALLKCVGSAFGAV